MISLSRIRGDVQAFAVEDTRRAILDRAVELVAEHGVRGVSFREVARRAGVSHQAPYHHFGNLHGILEAVAREGFASLAAAMKQAGEPHRDPVEAMTAMGLAYVEFATHHVGHFRVMFQRSLVDLHDPSAPIEEAVETYSVLLSCAHRVAGAGYGAGTEPDALAHVCWSMVHGLSVLIVEDTLQAKTPRDVHIEARRALEGFAALLRRSK